MRFIKFYDTNVLLDEFENILLHNEPFYIAAETIKELEDIKTSSKKDNDVKFKARQVLRFINNDEEEKCKIVMPKDYYQSIYSLSNKGLEVTPDNIILQIAAELNEPITFITNDAACRIIAKNIFGLKTTQFEDNESHNYTGFKELTSQAEQASFYEDNHKIAAELIPNQYLIINNEIYKLDSNNKMKRVEWKKLESGQFKVVEPKDVYQACAIDSMLTNQITLLRGEAGTGKSLLALGYLFYALDKGIIEKIIIFCNTTTVTGSKELGFYKGSKDDKILQGTIGNFLRSKLGDIIEIERLMGKMQGCQEKLIVLPMSDLRGFDTSKMNAGVFITEAQNTTKELMKLCLQRIGDDSKVIIDGDDTSQVDSWLYEGNNNGIKRLSEVFRGSSIYGEVTLQKCYRSKIANIAKNM